MRLLSVPRVAEAFRAQQGRWAAPSDLEAMGRDLEPRLAEAAAAAAAPDPSACEAIRRLHARGIKTAVICCTPRRLLGPQLAALEKAGLPLDCVVTADEACEPAPAPWGIFDVLQRLGIDDASELALIDDSPAGATAARNAGAVGVALAVEGQPPGADARAVLGGLDEVA
jgi:HAD superfamily hydrolase (TIGR01509 family)